MGALLLSATTLLPSAGHALAGRGLSSGRDAATTGIFGAGTQSLRFEPNWGQGLPGADFLARGDGYDAGLSANSITLGMSGVPVHATGRVPLLRMRLSGGNPTAQGRGEGLLPSTVSYLSAHNARPALAGIPTYAAVRYHAVYPGVDVVYYANRQRLEYDFQVAAGADPDRIRLSFQGAAPALAQDDSLLLRGASAALREQPPVIYQIVHGVRRAVAGGYALTGSTVGFRLGAYDRRLPLVIDPVLVYATYYGSAGNDIINAVAVDGRGNVYVAGNTNTSGDETRIVFISKFDPTGRHILYTKYISNVYGSAPTAACDSFASGIAVNARGDAYVTGTYGDGADNRCSDDAVLWAKVDPSGHQMVKTFGTAGGNRGAAIALDGQGYSYITGSTDNRPDNFPVTRGAFQTFAGIDRISDAGVAGDAFILKIDPSGNEVYGTFLGGSGIDAGTGIAVDGQGQAYVVGTTGIEPIDRVLNFPLTRNAFQVRARSLWAIGFLSKLSADGARLLYSTLLDGNYGENPHAVAVDNRGDAYVTGETISTDFPTTADAYKRLCGTDGACNVGQSCYYDQVNATNVCHTNGLEDAFLSVIDTSAAGPSSLLYSTYIGGGNRDMAEAIAVDGAGRAYLAGKAASGDFPMVHSMRRAGGWDGFVAELDPRRGRAALVFSSYLGGNGADEANGITLDRAGNVYVAGDTNSTTFPTAHAMQAADAGGYDGFIAKIGGLNGRP